jgi:hypothetical protein
MAEEILTVLRGNEGHNNEKYKLGELANVDTSAIRDETISDIEFFANAIFYQNLDNKFYYIDRLIKKKKLEIEDKE